MLEAAEENELALETAGDEEPTPVAEEVNEVAPEADPDVGGGYVVGGVGGL